MKIKKLQLVKTTIKDLKVKTAIQTGASTDPRTTPWRVMTEDSYTC